MGTSVSTYGFRINEEREILGFAQDTTYNRFCGDDNIGECEQGTKWEIKWVNVHQLLGGGLEGGFWFVLHFFRAPSKSNNG